MEYNIELSNGVIFSNDQLNAPESISYVNYEDIDYDKFFKNYLIQNIPCIIKDVTTNWYSNKHWVKNNGINFPYIQEKYGQVVVPIANCSEKYYNAQKKIDMTLSNYLTYFTGIQEGDKLLYLKDWHFQKDVQENIYNIPVYFASDWLNEYCLDTHKEDYMFIYLGPKGSWTPFHADVFSSFSWSVNIIGQKRWLLFPPGTEISLTDNLGNLPFDVTENEILLKNKIPFYEIYQNPGEALFVPSKWHHQVWNSKDTFSINHNWINGCNIHTVFEAMVCALTDIKKEISDCKDMDSFENHCQLMLNAMFGMNFQEFFNILYHISLKRINKIVNNDSIILFRTFSLGLNHCKFDLQRILSVLKDFIQHEDVMHIDCSVIKYTPNQLISKIENVLI